MTTFMSSWFDKICLITLGLFSTWVACPFLGTEQRLRISVYVIPSSHTPETPENITHLKYTEEKKIKKIIKQQTFSLQLEEDGDLGNIIFIFLNISSH